jgi:hypothetical protein
MAIIYSYNKTNSINDSDIFIISRFNEEDLTNQRRTLSVDALTLANYFSSNIPASDLDEVLTAGNESLLNAKIGQLYLYDTFSPSGYMRIEANKGRFNFYDKTGNYSFFTVINNGSIRLSDPSTGIAFIINKPTDMITAKTVQFQDQDGTIALLSDIPTTIPTTNYGLAAQVDSSTTIVNTTTESTLISNEYEGTLSVPANGFAIGDSFKVSLMGHINCLSSATLNIRVKTTAGVLLAGTGVINLDAATAKHWKLDVEFTIRQIGGEGVASIVSGGSFTYNKNASNNPEGFTFISINDNDFDTTIANELVITAQWNNASASNSIYSDIFTLNKVY